VSTSKSGGGSGKSDPFGAARPREQVLKQRGVDVALMDSRIERKAEVHHFTKEQEQEIEAVRSELEVAEANLRDANEKELPEETFRVAVEAKRKQLNDLMEKYGKMNPATSSVEKNESRSHKVTTERRRPSERRPVDGNDDDAFAHFSSNRRRHNGSGTSPNDRHAN
jgi:hypothetical protein